MEAQVFQLRKPIVVRNTAGDVIQTVEQLTVRTEVVAGDLRGIPMRSPPFAEDLLKMISRLSGQTQQVVDKMSLPDFDVVSSAVLGFMNGTPESDPGSPTETDGSTGSPQ